jgi:general transcription factor 3C polypeptide 3 (transcription factor C subunit 4)
LKLNAPSARDFLFLSTFHEIILAGNHLRLAANSYRAAFDWHVAKTKPDAPDSTMALEHIITLTDDLTALEQLEEAVLVVRRGQRWLQGRKREKRWDAVDDDREYDPPDFIREDPEDAEGAAEKEGGAGGKQADKDAPDVGQHPLEIPLRHRLAVLRLRLGDDNEAMVGW